MVGVVAHVRAGRGGIDPSLRGYSVLFRVNEINHCPGCGRAQWYVGRITAECVFCNTALPLAEAHWGENGSTWSHAGAPVGRRALDHDPLEKRREERRAGEGRLVQLLIDGSAQTFAVYNFSAGGVMIERSTELVKASLIEVVAPNGEIVGAAVRWTGDDVTGLQFSRPLRLDASSPDRGG